MQYPAVLENTHYNQRGPIYTKYSRWYNTISINTKNKTIQSTKKYTRANSVSDRNFLNKVLQKNKSLS